MLNPIWLNTFVTLVETEHFTQTAERLYMTQPGVSQHVQKLEQACGHQLLKREKKSFSITEQGQQVYQYAKELAEREQRLLTHLSFDDPYAGACSFASSGAVALLLYPKLLSLQEEHPQLSFSLKAAPNQQILNDIKAGVVDQGIVTDIPNKAFYDFHEIGKEELCLVLHSRYSFNESNLECSRETANNRTGEINGELGLEQLGLIDHPDAKQYLTLYIEQSQDSRLAQLDLSKLPTKGFVNQISQILEPVARGLGFTVLPRSAVDSYHSPERLFVLETPNLVQETLYLVRKKNRELPERYRQLNKMIEELLTSYG